MAVTASRWVYGLAAALICVAPTFAAAQVTASDPTRPEPWEAFRGVAYDPYPGGLQDLFDQDGDLVFPPVPERPYPVIVLVRPCSPGDEAGLRAGDVMLEINGQDARKIPKPWRDSRVGVVQQVTVRRELEVIETSLTEIAFGDWDEQCKRDPPSRR